MKCLLVLLSLSLGTWAALETRSLLIQANSVFQSPASKTAQQSNVSFAIPG
jgi:hypothetical protein